MRGLCASYARAASQASYGKNGSESALHAWLHKLVLPMTHAAACPLP
jgi:hypothetical protein